MYVYIPRLNVFFFFLTGALAVKHQENKRRMMFVFALEPFDYWGFQQYLYFYLKVSNNKLQSSFYAITMFLSIVETYNIT